ncbi:(Fe-S)-binding protein [Pseudonocardia sp.]|uniref:(Fe-S)-binding protein n=1 Tax=Pseudonocardia sp. TaxID=60912 RepID=UPI0031FDF537
MAVDKDIHQPQWKTWNARTDERTHEPVLGEIEVSQSAVRDWAEGLDIPVGGETVLFVDCEAAFYRTSVPRAVAQILQSAGYEFCLMGEPWCCGGPAAEMRYPEQAQRFARHNLDNWRSTGPGGSWFSIRTTASASPRTIRSTSATSSTSRSCWWSNCLPSCSGPGG